MEDLACQGSQSPVEAEGKQGFWLLAQWSYGCLCDHRQLVKSLCPLPGLTGKLDERQDLVRHQMLSLNGIFLGEKNANNCALTKGLIHSYQNICKWNVRPRYLSCHYLMCYYQKLFFELGNMMLVLFSFAVIVLCFSFMEELLRVCLTWKNGQSLFMRLVKQMPCLSHSLSLDWMTWLDTCRGRNRVYCIV